MRPLEQFLTLEGENMCSFNLWNNGVHLFQIMLRRFFWNVYFFWTPFIK